MLLREIARHQDANQTYLEEGIQLLELARRAAELFEKQIPKEQRRLLDFVLSNCTWSNGELGVTFRKPFDMLAVAVEGLEKDPSPKSRAAGDRPAKLPERKTLRNKTRLRSNDGLSQSFQVSGEVADSDKRV